MSILINNNFLEQIKKLLHYVDLLFVIFFKLFKQTEILKNTMQILIKLAGSISKSRNVIISREISPS